MTETTWHDALREPFPEAVIGKLPRSTCKDCSDSKTKRCERHSWVNRCPECGGNHSSATIHLDFVGHAAATDRLLKVDPEWTWRPFTQEEIVALPPAYREAGLWIMLTVHGVTRPGFGDAQGKSGPNAVKEAIGDAIRNAAMRFGVALDLWSKTELREQREADQPQEPTPEQQAYWAAQAQVKATWEKHRGPFDFQALEAHFRETQGLPIDKATTDDLLSYATSLEVAALPEERAIEGTVIDHPTARKASK